MQRIATKIFIGASIAFGIIGIILVVALPGRGQQNTDLNIFLSRLLMITVFIILPSFALSVAAKYLNGKK